MGQELDELRYLRLPEIIGCKRRGIRGLYPVSASHWWAGVQSGRYPKQVKLSARVSAWRASDIRELLSRGVEGGPL
jgi:prophage regulatory protein